MSNLRSMDALAEMLSVFKGFLDASLSGSLFSDGSLQPQDKLAENYKLLRELKDVQNVVGSISGLLEDKIQTMEDMLVRSSHHHGIKSLPREIFLRIIEMLCIEEDEYDRTEANKAIRQLSLVSKDFRAAVLDLVSLWTRVDTRYCSQEGFETRISRAKDAPLTLSFDVAKLYDKDYIPIYEPALSNAFRLRDRYRQVKIFFRDGIETISERFPQMQFPEVETAILKFYATQTEWRDLLGSWTFPKVKRLELFDAVPPPECFTSLIEFRLRMLDVQPPQLSTEIFHRLMDFLRHLRCLQTLSIDIHGADDPLDLDFPTVDLPTVTSLFVSNGRWNPNDDSIPAYTLGRLLQAMKVPNAKDVRLRIAIRGDETAEEILEPLSSADAVKNTSSLCVWSWCPFEGEFVEDFLGLFPNVENMEIRVPKFISTAACSSIRIPKFDKLRSLVWDYEEPYGVSRAQAVANKFTDNPESLHMSFTKEIEPGYLDDL